MRLYWLVFWRRCQISSVAPPSISLGGEDEDVFEALAAEGEGDAEEDEEGDYDLWDGGEKDDDGGGDDGDGGGGGREAEY